MGKAFIGNFKGQKGDTGPEGKQGRQGIQGPAGPKGEVDANTPIAFTEATSLANIESGESISTIFGKTKKILGSLLIGAGSTLLGQNLAAARALVSDANGKIGASAVTAAELQYLSGVTKNIQAQFGELNGNISDVNNDITQKDLMIYRLPAGLSRDNNADNFKKTGYYFTNTETKNAAEYGIISVVSVPAPWITQTWHRLDGDIYTREYSNHIPKWSEWRSLTFKSSAPLDINGYTWTSGSATVNRIGDMVFVALGILNVTCASGGKLLKIPDGFTPNNWTSIPFLYEQNGQDQMVCRSADISEGYIIPTVALENAHVILNAHWKI